MSNQRLTVDECRKMLKRIAWRIQYQAKKQRARECPAVEAVLGVETMETDLSGLYVRELLNVIPSEKGKWVVQRVILQGYTEKEVARELHMTQQGVHKCKTRTLHQLRAQLKDLIG